MNPETIEKIRKTIPELPRARKLRFIEQYKIAQQAAETLTDDMELADYFENVSKNAGLKAEPKIAANWILSETSAYLNSMKIMMSEFQKTVPAADTAELLNFVEAGVISGKMAKDIYADMAASGKKPGEIIDEKGLKQISDTGELEKAALKVIEDHPAEAKKFREGNDKLIGFFVGEVMKATKGQANPKAVNDILRKKL
jgi:aspartyl-tRNA(Asn)/glutamyl-tRNA(Gln) amidotransferase subunit B